VVDEASAGGVSTSTAATPPTPSSSTSPKAKFLDRHDATGGRQGKI